MHYVIHGIYHSNKLHVNETVTYLIASKIMLSHVRVSFFDKQEPGRVSQESLLRLSDMKSYYVPMVGTLMKRKT